MGMLNTTHFTLHVCVYMYKLQYISLTPICGLFLVLDNSTLKWKKRSERRKHCALAVVRLSETFLPRRRSLHRGLGRPKFNQLETATTFTYKPSLVRTQFWVIMVTDPHTHTHTHTHTQDRLQYSVPQLASMQCNQTSCVARIAASTICPTSCKWTATQSFQFTGHLLHVRSSHLIMCTRWPLWSTRMSVTWAFVLHPYTKYEVHRPKDMADFRSRRQVAWWP